VDTLIPFGEDELPAEAATAPLAARERPVLWALAGLLAIQLAILVYVCAFGLVREPFSDMFDFLRAEFDFERTGDLAGYLAAPHNGQYLVWVRVLTALDVQVLRGSAMIFPVTGGLCILGAGLAIGWEIWRDLNVRLVGAVAAILAVMLAATSVNAIDCVQPINVVYALAFVFAAVAIVLFERAGEAQPGQRVVLATLAFVAALAAVAGSAAGAAVFAAMAVSALRHPRQRGLAVPTLLVGLCAGAAVFAGLVGQAPGGGPAPQLAKMARYMLAYAGLPWSAIGALARIRLVIGGATISVGVTLLWRGSRRTATAGRLERIGLDLMLFALVTAAMAAVGRADQSAEVVVPVRYAVFMSAFQIGLICRLAPILADRWTAMRRYALPAAGALAVGLLVQQAAYGANVLKTSDIIRREVAAFEAGARSPSLHQTIHPDFNLAAHVEAECRRRGIYQ
jgi:hypothetical protein